MKYLIHFFFLILPAYGHALLIIVDDVSYDLNTVQGSFTENQALLESQAWWGNETLARSLTAVVGDGFGLLYEPFPGLRFGPFFAYGIFPQAHGMFSQDESQDWLHANMHVETSQFIGVGTLSSTALDAPSFIGSPFQWVVETVSGSVSVTEPSSLALLGLGLAGVGFSRKKKRR